MDIVTTSDKSLDTTKPLRKIKVMGYIGVYTDRPNRDGSYATTDWFPSVEELERYNAWSGHSLTVPVQIYVDL